MKIELWGTYPPPIGGVTIHVYRLIHSLHANNRNILLRNFGKVDPQLPYVRTVKCTFGEFLKLLFVPSKIIHLHSNNVRAFFLLLFCGWKHKIGITIHNKNLINEKSFLHRKVIKLFLQRTSFIVMNDADYGEKMQSNFHLDASKLHILPAFLPPAKAEYIGLSSDILYFRETHDFLISANAYKLRLVEGIDVYGLDLLIRLVENLKLRRINVGLIFCLPLIGDEKYYEVSLRLIAEKGLNKNILILQRMLPNGFEVWKLSDLFIRPTLTDIEGISVKESLYEGTPVIASDVCERPPEAILFKNRNYEDLEKKVLDFYYHHELYSALNFKCDGDVGSQLMDIYRTLDK